MCDSERISLLIRILHDEDKDKRKLAMEALVECGNSAVLPLINLLDDGSWVVRYRAAEALGLIGDERSTGPLTNLLKDEKDHVRYMAAKGLGFIKKPASSISLIPLLKDENEYVRKMAAVSIGKIGGNGTALSALAVAAEKETCPATMEAMRLSLNRLSNKE